MLLRRPFRSLEALLLAADEAWRATGPPDWDEAFAHHPRIGERKAPAPVSAAAQTWSAGEQGAVSRADAAARVALAEANGAYERRFGRIYLVCAAGRSVEDLLENIEARMRNDPGRELAVAVEEQREITRLRLQALLGGGSA
jgi:2-oxo-4-hydroxy-4-carboxy-5-ureidoimidazoline decarboxylase